MSKRFRYPLDALLRKRRADWKTVKAEEATASQVVNRQNDEVRDAASSVSSVESTLRESFQSGMRIDPLQQELLSGYLSQQRSALKQKQQALTKAQEVHQQVATSLEGIGRGIKSLEKHREGRETGHRLEQHSLEQKQVDELWLLRQRKERG